MIKKCFWILLLVSTAAFAQKKPIDTTGIDVATNIPSIADPKKDDAVSSFTQQQVDTVNKIKVNYTKYAYDYKIKLYNWQLQSSKYIFTVVVIVVMIGLYLSFLQFKLSAKQHDRPVVEKTDVTVTATQEGDREKEPAVTSLEVTKDGIKIQSAVIGLIILVISIVFFFLYLKFVFPINDIGAN